MIMYRLAEIKTQTPLATGGFIPVVERLDDGDYILTSKSIELQMSKDDGETWDTIPMVTIDIVD